MKNFFISLIILFIIIILIASGWFVLQILDPLALDGNNNFVIKKNESVNQISYNLKERGIIRNSFAFEVYVFLKDIDHRFQSGKYELPKVLNMKRLVEILTTGQKADEWKLTIIEGWTIKNIASKLEDLGKFQSKKFLEATSANSLNNKFNFDISSYKFLADKPKRANLEGYLFPDTYRFFTDATIKDVIVKILDNFDKKLTLKLRKDIKSQNKNIFEIVTLASIIEREVMDDKDRPIVSGIFWKRIKAGVPLQADSTINYITGKKDPSVSAKDLGIDSLYNTYIYPGLPPGPISNPGLSSIKAAIYPQESEYWYFLTDKNGKVHYSRTFKEHVLNKKRYLK